MRYPIGIQDFEKLRKTGCVYVDKTALIYQLTRLSSSHFLSRPRRFGKSLLISTLEAYFLGKKELFQGLAMAGLETEWETYPVLRLDLNAQDYSDVASLNEELDKHLRQWEATYGMDADRTRSAATRFYNVILQAHQQTGKPVVVLVDEYDKPLLSSIDNEELNAVFRNTLKGFFGVLKTLDAHIRFALLTGVSRFSHVSIFSDLNNLKDISMDRRYVDICGISETELHAYFDESIRELAAANEMTPEEATEELRRRYDGYHFCQNTVGIYNPFSLLNTFDEQVFSDYWFSTGTPTFLIKELRRNHYDLGDVSHCEATEGTLKSIYSERLNPIALLYQSGYLTIKGYDKEYRLYTLGFPNEEVERSFTRALVPYYVNLPDEGVDTYFAQFVRDVKKGRPEDFMRRIQTMLADNDYRVAGRMELYFQNTLGIIFKMLGFQVQVERATSQGRMDVTLQTPDYVYILELKLDGSAEEALQQIKDKQYALPFQMESRKLFLIGANFSSDNRTLSDWKIENSASVR